MVEVDIRLRDGKHRYTVGETVAGTARLNLQEVVPLQAVVISFHCHGEVKWIEVPTSPHYFNGYPYTDQIEFHEEVAQWSENDVYVEHHATFKLVEIPFSFIIPKDKSLPSTMLSKNGFIQYYIRVTIQHPNRPSPTKYIKEFIVESPLTSKLFLTVGGSAEKSPLLHYGTVSIYASIGRKGFYPGEAISVHLSIDNQSTTSVTPRASLHQVQIYMCQNRHKTIHSTVTPKAIEGSEIAPHSAAEELLSVPIPAAESLTIKCGVIAIKYLVHVTLDIPHALDLHVNLPIIVTTKKAIEEGSSERGPEII